MPHLFRRARAPLDLPGALDPSSPSRALAIVSSLLTISVALGINRERRETGGGSQVSSLGRSSLVVARCTGCIIRERERGKMGTRVTGGKGVLLLLANGLG